jgi:hypothetical protein
MSAGRTLRAAAAGALAAGAWAAVEPRLRELTGGYHSQVRLIGGLAAPDGPWHQAGLAIHLANGAMFGVGFAWLGLGGVGQGILAAEAENTLLWPAVGVLDRLHPDVRSGAWPPLARNPNAFAQEVLGHAAFGAVLGALIPRAR